MSLVCVPPGFRIDVVVGRNGRRDKYFYAPDGTKLRSVPDVRRWVAARSARAAKEDDDASSAAAPHASVNTAEATAAVEASSPATPPVEADAVPPVAEAPMEASSPVEAEVVPPVAEAPMEASPPVEAEAVPPVAEAPTEVAPPVEAEAVPPVAEAPTEVALEAMETLEYAPTVVSLVTREPARPTAPVARTPSRRDVALKAFRTSCAPMGSILRRNGPVAQRFAHSLKHRLPIAPNRYKF